jgi:hypothetical protein
LARFRGTPYIECVVWPETLPRISRRITFAGERT